MKPTILICVFVAAAVMGIMAGMHRLDAPLAVVVPLLAAQP